MARGSKPKPTALKLLNGNPGKRPLNDKEIKPRPKAPKRPTWIKGEAKKLWVELGPEMERLGILTEIDGPAFAALCYSYGQFVELAKDIKKEGRIHTTPNGHKQARAEVSLIKAYLGLIRAFCADFGLNPSERSRLKGIPEKFPGEDAIEEYM